MSDSRAYRVLMVCTGNICRSVMAQAVLEAQAERDGVPVMVDSCGISDEEQGNPPDRRAMAVLRAAGYSVPEHRARQITPADLENFDLILTMTQGHYRAVQRLSERLGVSPDVRMYCSFVDQPTADVPDPWYGGRKDFEQTLETIEAVTPKILSYVREEESH